MKKIKSPFRYLRITLLFAFLIFLFQLAALLISFLVTYLLVALGLAEETLLHQPPVLRFSITSILIGTLLAFLFSRIPLKPLREIMDAVDRIADGDYHVRLQLKGPDEFRSLSEKFNHMAEELESVELLRSDFVNNFSHEFKTPISSIRGFAKALKWDELSAEEREEYLDIIIGEAERLSSLSANVLYLSKIEKQTILTDRKSLNISEQIRLVCALLDHRVCEKHLEIVFESTECTVCGNEEMLKQAWINLLDNAIKFSPEYGHIGIQIQQTPSGARIQISNPGAPISAEVREHIFDKFYQGDLSHSTAGNGLGLAIAKKIILLHGGSITVFSEAGAIIFTVILSATDP